MVVTNISYEYDRLGKNNPDPHHPHFLQISSLHKLISGKGGRLHKTANCWSQAPLPSHSSSLLLNGAFIRISPKISQTIFRPLLFLTYMLNQLLWIVHARGIEWSYRSVQIGCKTDSFCPFLPFFYTLEISSISLFHSIFRPSFHIHLKLCFLEKVSKHRS